LNKRILLFCDSKWRDLPGFALLKTVIERSDQSAQIAIVPYNYWNEALTLFSPHVVVINHIQGRRNRMIADWVKRNRGHVVVMFNEGIIEFEDRRDIFKTQANSQFVDEFLCWNDEVSAIVDGITVGCPRFDIYRMGLVDSRARMKEKYGILPESTVILWGDSWPSARFSYQMKEFHRDNWRDLSNTVARQWGNADQFAQEQFELQQRFKGYILIARSMFPQLEMVVKTHPMSDLNSWRRFGDDHGIKILHNEYIGNAISMCDIYVTKLGSTTVPEAWMSGRKVIKIRDSYLTASSEEQEQADEYNVADINELLNSLNDSTFEVRPTHVEYLSKWGFAHENAAQAVAGQILALKSQKTVHDPKLENFYYMLAEKDAQAQPVDPWGNFDKYTDQRSVREWQNAILSKLPSVQ
jgi:surface carbohydrate biosynthesis protein